MNRYLLFIVFLFICATVAEAQLSYQTSWIGNTFSGKSKWVQQDIADIFVTPDGRVFSNVFWDENGGEVTEYYNGDIVKTAQNTHGWGYHGGDAVTANSKYVYFGYFIENEGGGLVDPYKWPKKGYDWYGITRRMKTNIQTATLFEGGMGGKTKGSYLVIHELPNNTKGAHISGLAADDSLLFVGCPYDNKIRVFNSQTMKPVREWAVSKPGQLALDQEGMLWIVSEGVIKRCNHYGELMPQQISFSDDVLPYDIAADKTGRLLVTDHGVNNQIRIYENITSAPTFVKTFGTPYGIFAGPVVGEFGDLRFNNPIGVGVDAAGNLYVASSSSSAGETGGGGGVVLESYQESGALNWRVMGLEFIDCASPDPTSEIDIYTKEEHFILDYSKPAGQQWLYKGYTVNKFKYPDDPRLHNWSAGAKMQRIQGRLFMFVNTMHIETLFQCYRFNHETDGEIAIPSVFFAGRPYTDKGSWPNGQPKSGEYIWRDANGNGAFDAGIGEYLTNKNMTAPNIWGWSVDSDGTVWQAAQTDGIRRFPMQGFDEHGNPIWTFDTMQTLKNPAPINRLERIYYDPKKDAMYLVGYTRENPHHDGMWKIMGREVVRYDQWSTGNRTASWRIVPDYLKDSSGDVKPASVAITDDYLFICYVKEERVDIYSTETGEFVGEMNPLAIVGDCGWVDIPEGIEAFKRENGDYIIFVEEDAKAKVIMYQWNPTGVKVGKAPQLPQEFALLPVSPNPFNPSTQITFSMPVHAEINVSVFNLLGQKVRTLIDESRNAGVHTVIWNGLNDDSLQVAGGLYLIRFQVEDKVLIRKALFVK